MFWDKIWMLFDHLFCNKGSIIKFLGNREYYQFVNEWFTPPVHLSNRWWKLSQTNFNKLAVKILLQKYVSCSCESTILLPRRKSRVNLTRHHKLKFDRFTSPSSLSWINISILLSVIITNKLHFRIYILRSSLQSNFD